MTGLELIPELFESASIETAYDSPYVALYAEDWTVVLKRERFDEFLTTEYENVEELQTAVREEAVRNMLTHWALSSALGPSVPLEKFLAEGTQTQ